MYMYSILLFSIINQISNNYILEFTISSILSRALPVSGYFEQNVGPSALSHAH